MKITIKDPATVVYKRQYPCLVRHIGISSTGSGNPDWKDNIVFACSRHYGVVLIVNKPNEFIQVGGLLAPKESTDFELPHWEVYFGVVELDNTLAQNEVAEPSERRLDTVL